MAGDHRPGLLGSGEAAGEEAVFDAVSPQIDPHREGLKPPALIEGQALAGIFGVVVGFQENGIGQGAGLIRFRPPRLSGNWRRYRFFGPGVRPDHGRVGVEHAIGLGLAGIGEQPHAGQAGLCHSEVADLTARLRGGDLSICNGLAGCCRGR